MFFYIFPFKIRTTIENEQIIAPSTTKETADGGSIETTFGILSIASQDPQEKSGENVAHATISKMTQESKSTRGETSHTTLPILVDVLVVGTRQEEQEHEDDQNVPLVQVPLSEQ